MSHLKNTTASLAKQGLRTVSMPIGSDLDVLEVRAGVGALEALEDSSSRLGEALLFIRDHMDSDTGLKTSGAWMVQQSLENAKGILDSLVMGIMQARKSEVQSEKSI